MSPTRDNACLFSNVADVLLTENYGATRHGGVAPKWHGVDSHVYAKRFSELLRPLLGLIASLASTPSFKKLAADCRARMRLEPSSDRRHFACSLTVPQEAVRGFFYGQIPLEQEGAWSKPGNCWRGRP
jgi:hypothetical protein